jgi:glycine/D-amino acid oxidase-like deaminating enzyme
MLDRLATPPSVGGCADAQAGASSLWERVTPRAPALPKLTAPTRTTVLIIGAGFTGLSAALHLRQNGVDVIVIDAQQLGGGASGRNSGLVIPTLTRPDPDDIVAEYRGSGERFLALLRDSADNLFETARALQLQEQAEQTGWLQPAHSAGRMALIEQRAAQWSRWGAKVNVVGRDEATRLLGSGFWHGGLLIPSGGIVNPLVLVRAMAKALLAAGGAIYTQSPCLSVAFGSDGWTAKTPLATVRADRLIIATNAYTDQFSTTFQPTLAREIVPVTSWLVATEPIPESVRDTVLPGRLAMSDTRGDLHFARYDADHRLISGGALINPIDRPARMAQLVTERLGRIWPQLRGISIESVWNGRIGITPDRFPRFHQIGPNAFAWIGCNGRAVALSLAVGRELAKAAIGVPLEQVALPMSEPTPLAAQPLMRWLAPLALLHYRRSDAREYHPSS